MQQMQESFVLLRPATTEVTEFLLQPVQMVQLQLVQYTTIIQLIDWMINGQPIPITDQDLVTKMMILLMNLNQTSPHMVRTSLLPPPTHFPLYQASLKEWQTMTTTKKQVQAWLLIQRIPSGTRNTVPELSTLSAQSMLS